MTHVPRVEHQWPTGFLIKSVKVYSYWRDVQCSNAGVLFAFPHPAKWKSYCSIYYHTRMYRAPGHVFKLRENAETKKPLACPIISDATNKQR